MSIDAILLFDNTHLKRILSVILLKMLSPVVYGSFWKSEMVLHTTSVLVLTRIFRQWKSQFCFLLQYLSPSRSETRLSSERDWSKAAVRLSESMNRELSLPALRTLTNFLRASKKSSGPVTDVKNKR